MIAEQRRDQSLRAAAVPVPYHRLRDRLRPAVAGWLPPAGPSDPAWWAQPPIWLFVPLACTIPVILLFGRQWIGARRQVAASAPQPAAAMAESRW
jgi:hypothetical protein